MPDQHKAATPQGRGSSGRWTAFVSAGLLALSAVWSQPVWAGVETVTVRLEEARCFS
jgi:hypothetical protein